MSLRGWCLRAQLRAPCHPVTIGEGRKVQSSKVLGGREPGRRGNGLIAAMAYPKVRGVRSRQEPRGMGAVPVRYFLESLLCR